MANNAPPNAAVRDAQSLLAAYPMGSAVPSAHVARHLDHLTIAAPPPSFVQPDYYHHQSYNHHGNPPPYTEYAAEVAYMAQPNQPQTDAGYWENTRNDAMRLVHEQAGNSYPYPQWTSPSSSSYPTSALANSMFAYPTPPPLPIPNSMASSSLAGALGPAMMSVNRPPQSFPQNQAHPDQSAVFFDDFLATKSQQIQQQRQMSVTEARTIPNSSPPSRASSSLNSSAHIPNLGTSTPRKRKMVVELVTPSAKRANVNGVAPGKSSPLATPSRKTFGLNTPSTTHSSTSSAASTAPTTVPPTPSTTATSTPTRQGSTGLKRKTFTLDCIEIPTKPCLTPSTSRLGKSISSPSLLGSEKKQKMMYDTEDDDDELNLTSSPVKPLLYGGTSPSKGTYGTGRKTHERDERAPIEKLITLLQEIFDAEDSLPPDPSSSDLPQDYFLADSVDLAKPQLAPAAVKKLTKYVVQVAKPGRSVNANLGSGGTPGQRAQKGRGRLGDVDTSLLARLLRMLGRSTRIGEDVDAFDQAGSERSDAHSTQVPQRSPKKRKSKTPVAGEEPEGDGTEEMNQNELDIPKTPKKDKGKAKISTVSVPTDLELEKLLRKLEMGRDGVLAAECVVAMLGSERLAKSLYSEELITSCLSTIKNQLERVIYPFVEACGDLSAVSTTSSLLFHLATSKSSATQTVSIQHLKSPSKTPMHTSSSSKPPSSSSNKTEQCRRLLSEIFQALSAVLPRLSALVSAENVAMSESVVVKAVYVGIGPFFVGDAGAGGTREGHSEGITKSKSKKEKGDGGLVMTTFGKSAMRGLRLDALALIRSIFANHDEQRSWIIEEILSSLIKLSDTKQKAGQFRLREGRSIRTVSALLLQLVQTSAHDVRVGARRVEKKRQAKFALKRQESLVLESQQSPQDEEFLDEEDQEEIRLYSTGLNGANIAAKTIILFLTQRSGKGKATKNSNEAEYRTIFDNLISDMLVVLFWPEWPAASLLLSIACMYMVGSLEDVKSANGTQNDNNAGKTMALDHLGVIAARIRTTVLKMQEEKEAKEEGVGTMRAKWRGLKPMDEIVAKADSKELDRLLAAYRDVTAHLCKRSSEDQAYDSAQELTNALLGQELASALKKVDNWVDSVPDEDDSLNIKDPKKIQVFGEKLKSALRLVWKDQGTDVFDIGSHDESIRIDRQAEEIGAIQNLRNAFNPILNVILQALDAPAIFMRTKALRALGQIVTSDATILAAPNVRRAIESHLLDSSSAVRDAAVELIGKYMIDSPEVADDYYPKVADRIADTGLGVRKRVIKLLKSFYIVTSNISRQIDIATKLVLRMVDEDETVRDLAAKTVEELWFPGSTITKTSATTQEQDDNMSLYSKVAVIMGVAAHFRDRQSPLEDLLHKIMSSKEGAEAAMMHSRYEEICGALIDGLVDASDLPGFSVINCIRTINLITSAYPSVVGAQSASTLLPYLKNAANSVEDQHTCDYLLRIFRASIPHMPRTAAKFGQELQATLQPMIIKPNAGGIATLQEAIACMCTVVRHLTHDFKRLVALLKSCNGRLQGAIKKPQNQPMSANDYKPLATLIFIVSLLAEHCNFDHLRAERVGEFPELDSISQGSIIEHIYNTLLELYEKHADPGLRARILQCLGFLFRAQPTLMTMERSASIMDSIFSAPEEEGKTRLLKIIQDFLIAESIKHAAKEKEGAKRAKPEEVNMEELVGNTDGFADSGVSSAVVQRYLDPILAAALSQNVHTQASAIDILTFTVKQGLAHPLQSFPTIVALETSPNTSLSNRASALHAVLHNKHTSLLNSRYTNSAKASFDYQRKISPDLVQGYRLQPTPVAVLQRWYSLVREKRALRQDFLKALVKVFQERPNYQSTQDDIDFTRYMAENFSAFEYKTQEEVMTIIKYLTVVLSTTGTHILEVLSPSHLLSSLRTSPGGLVPPQAADNHPAVVEENLQEKLPFVRTSVIVAMVMLLKTHLKTLYSLSEDKCSKFVIGKKSAIGDKNAVKRHDKPISWDRLPFATKPILSTADAEAQKSTFLDIWNEDGVAAEPEEDFFQ